MTQFVHITDARLAARIQRSGISMGRAPISATRGVYCVPVISEFARTFQWAREMKRSGARALVAVQFKIPDDATVYVGRYNQQHMAMTANAAAQTFRDHVDGQGLETIIPVRISANWIAKIYPAPRLVGWRYFPEAKGKPPFCGCRYCNRGRINAYRVIKAEGFPARDA